MKSFIILEHEPLTVRLKKIWNIDALKSREVHVEYWDLSQYIFPEAIIPQVVEDDCIRKVKDLSALEYLLKQTEVSLSVFVLEIFPKWDNRALILLLHRYQCRCVKIDLYANTMLPSSSFERILSKLNNFTFRKLCKKLAWRIFLQRHSIQIYDKVLSSSKLVNPDIRINHPDYEEYLSLNGKKFNIEMDGPYLLFIDNYYPLHPDIKNMYSDILVDATEYWKLMRRFFDFLETKFHAPIVIAAHPKAVYSGEEFGGRRIFWGQTANLIKHADIVVMHGSNSLSYIALADKPFAIVYPNTYKTYPYMYKQVLNLARYCHKKAYNLDLCDWGEIEFLKWDKELREKYIYGFLTSRVTENRWNVDVWVKELLME